MRSISCSMLLVVVILQGACTLLPGVSARALSSGRSAAPTEPAPAPRPTAAAAGEAPAPPAAAPPARSEEDERLWDEFVELSRPHSDALAVLHRVDLDEEQGGYFDTAAHTVEQLLAAKALAPACARYAAVRGPDNAVPYRVPARACELIGRADELAVAYVDLTARRHVAENADSMRSQVGYLAERGELDESHFNWVAFSAESIARLADKLTAFFELVARPTPADLLAPFDGIAEAFTAAVAAQAPKAERPGEHHGDKVAEQVVRRQFTANAYGKRKYKVRKVWIADDDWIIVRGSVLPLRREKGSYALVQLGEERFCRLYFVVVAQDYAGGGRYQRKGYATPRPMPRVATCK